MKSAERYFAWPSWCFFWRAATSSWSFANSSRYQLMESTFSPKKNFSLCVGRLTLWDQAGLLDSQSKQVSDENSPLFTALLRALFALRMNFVSAVSRLNAVLSRSLTLLFSSLQSDVIQIRRIESPNTCRSFFSSL